MYWRGNRKRPGHAPGLLRLRGDDIERPLAYGLVCQRRIDYMAKRPALMDDWGRYLSRMRAPGSSNPSFSVHRILEPCPQAVAHGPERPSIPPREMGRPGAQAQGPLGGLAAAPLVAETVRACHPHHCVSCWRLRHWLHRQPRIGEPSVVNGAGVRLQHQGQHQPEHWRANLSRPWPALLRNHADLHETRRALVL